MIFHYLIQFLWWCHPSPRCSSLGQKWSAGHAAVQRRWSDDHRQRRADCPGLRQKWKPRRSLFKAEVLRGYYLPWTRGCFKIYFRIRYILIEINWAVYPKTWHKFAERIEVCDEVSPFCVETSTDEMLSKVILFTHSTFIVWKSCEKITKNLKSCKERVMIKI